MTRKEALTRFAAVGAVAGLFAAGTTGIAEAKGSKAQFKYQDHPKGSAQCSNCRFFKPGSSPTANGTCSVVSGSISPKGWCIAFSAKT